MSQIDPQSERSLDTATRFIPVTTAAERSGLSVHLILRLLRRGEMFGVQIGKSWFTTQEALQDYLATHRCAGVEGEERGEGK